jgi:soluble lytic murein transglycosylase-like protein/Tfp pilus assembly protein PilF
VKVSSARFLTAVVLILTFLATVPKLRSTPDSKATLVLPPGHLVQQPLSPPANLYAEAAQALRKGNLQEARQNLEAVARETPSEAVQARVVEGLYAHEAGDPKLAGELLAASATPGGELEDWRLFLLAERAAKDGDRERARATYNQLIAGCPESPLRPFAFLKSAELARDADQPRLALALIEQARAAGVDGEAAADLESLAWKIGRELADQEVQRAAGRQLLIENPLSREALEAVRTFRVTDGRAGWAHLLSPEEVLRRARSFLQDESPSAALLTLNSIAEEERGFEWHLLKAQALTRARRGVEALALLNGVVPSALKERASLEWERALAAADAATARGGRENLPTPARRRMLEASHLHLANVVRTSADLDLSKDALRQLYEDYLEADLLEPALDTLRALRRIDPLDGTGTGDLWENGWALYGSGNLSGAVGVWSEMEEVYPDHRETQRARYWKARALEELGQPGRARGLYRDLAASSDTSDFYARQALSHLGQEPGDWDSAALLAQTPAGPWPSDPGLRRAKLLTDLGLDELAAREMELVEDRADPRELLALQALIRCRGGDLRTGLILLREAYPALGGPTQSTVPVEVLYAYYPLEHAEAIRARAAETGVPASLIAGIIRQESAFDTRATSPVGARGLMQLMPATAREVSGKLGLPYRPEELYDPERSVHLGSTYFREVLDRFDGNVELALAGYNGGPNRIRRLWREAGPDVRLDEFLETLGLDESRNYVKRILVLADSYRQLYPSLG